LIVCCSPCVPRTRRRSSRCWASSHRRPHRALRTPGRVSKTRWELRQARWGLTPLIREPAGDADRASRRSGGGADWTIGLPQITTPLRPKQPVRVDPLRASPPERC
jgi:hypothetical protein